MKPTREDWREHGDMLALIVRARTGYKILRKPTPDLDRAALVELVWKDVLTRGESPRERAGNVVDRLREAGSCER